VTSVLKTPIKVGTCFGVPRKKGIDMMLIISISDPQNARGNFSVRYAYFSSGKVTIMTAMFNTYHCPDGKASICNLWPNDKIVLL